MRRDCIFHPHVKIKITVSDQCCLTIITKTFILNFRVECCCRQQVMFRVLITIIFIALEESVSCRDYLGVMFSKSFIHDTYSSIKINSQISSNNKVIDV